MNSNRKSQNPLHWIQAILPKLIGLGLFLGLWQVGAMGISTVILPKITREHESDLLLRDG